MEDKYKGTGTPCIKLGIRLPQNAFMGEKKIEIELPLFKELLVVENVKGYPIDKEVRAVTPTEQAQYSFLERRSGNDCECPVCTQ